MSETEDARMVASFLHTGIVHIAQKLRPLGDGILVIKLAARGPRTVDELAAGENLTPYRVQHALTTLAERGWVGEQT